MQPAELIGRGIACLPLGELRFNSGFKLIKTLDQLLLNLAKGRDTLRISVYIARSLRQRRQLERAAVQIRDRFLVILKREVRHQIRR